MFIFLNIYVNSSTFFFFFKEWYFNHHFFKIQTFLFLYFYFVWSFQNIYIQQYLCHGYVLSSNIHIYNSPFTWMLHINKCSVLVMLLVLLLERTKEEQQRKNTKIFYNLNWKHKSYLFRHSMVRTTNLKAARLSYVLLSSCFLIQYDRCHVNGEKNI